MSTISPQAENISATPSIVGLSRGRFTATTVLIDWRLINIEAELTNVGMIVISDLVTKSLNSIKEMRLTD